MRKRRSSAQIQQEQKSATASAAASEDAKNTLELQKKHIAAFEDLLRKEDQLRDKKKGSADPLLHHPVSAVVFYYLIGNIHVDWMGKTNTEATDRPNEGIHACDKLEGTFCIFHSNHSIDNQRNRGRKQETTRLI